MIIQICCINRLSFHSEIHLSIQLQQHSRYIICFKIKISLTAYGFNMSSDGFNVCKFYVPRGSIHIFITFYLFFPFFCSKRRSYSKKARPFKIPRKLKPPLNAAHLFYFQILSCINFSIFFNISRKQQLFLFLYNNVYELVIILNSFSQNNK